MKIYTWEKYSSDNNIDIDNRFYANCIICLKQEIDYVTELNNKKRLFYYCHDCFFEIYRFMNNLQNKCNCEKCTGVKSVEDYYDED